MDFLFFFWRKRKIYFFKKKCKVPPSGLALKETLKREELLSKMLRRARKRLRRRTSHAQRQRERKSSRCSRNSSCRRNHHERRGARESKSAKFDTETDGDFGQSPWGPRKPAEFLVYFWAGFSLEKPMRILLKTHTVSCFRRSGSCF